MMEADRVHRQRVEGTVATRSMVSPHASGGGHDSARVVEVLPSKSQQEHPSDGVHPAETHAMYKTRAANAADTASAPRSRGTPSFEVGSRIVRMEELIRGKHGAKNSARDRLKSKTFTVNV
jgi:hypothetical protein